MTSRCRTTLNQRWNHVLHANLEIYNVEQRRINIIYSTVVTNNVRQRRNNVLIFNIEFYNVGRRRNNVVNMTISKKNIWASNKKNILFKSFNYYSKIFFTLFPILRGIRWRILAKPQNSQKAENTVLQKLCLNLFIL